jgi:hypothetical protein
MNLKEDKRLKRLTQLIQKHCEDNDYTLLFGITDLIIVMHAQTGNAFVLKAIYHSFKDEINEYEQEKLNK